MSEITTLRGRCFVIMPYGKRQLRDASGATVEVDFQQVFDEIIAPGAEAAGLRAEKSEDVQLTGLITKGMFADLFACEAAVADISAPNANVFYELGIRHGLKPNCTLLIRHADAAPMSSDGGGLPFDLSDVRHIPYRLTPEGVAEARNKVARFLRNSMEAKMVDSPVHEALPHLAVGQRQRAVETRKRYKFALDGHDGALLGVIEGPLNEVHDIDAWVNSENTQFEMARFAERSISSAIRYLGSTKKSRDGAQIFGDEIAKDLVAAKRRLVQNRSVVPEGTVVLTPPRELKHAPFHVRVIAHVAAVAGKPIAGFFPVNDLPGCVIRVLDALAEGNRKRGPKQRIRSVVFPLFGAGQAKTDPSLLADQYISAAIAFLQRAGDADLKQIYFLGMMDGDRDLLLRELAKFPELKQL